MAFNLNNKRFITSGNPSGLSTNETVFHYFQSGETITGKYRGGAIKEGLFVGKMPEDHRLELLFQCITQDQQLLSGSAEGSIHEDSDGRLNLMFQWRWLSGAEGRGQSHYLELSDKSV